MDQLDIANIDVLAGTINARPPARDPGDDGLNVKFSLESHFCDDKTRESGRAVFEMKEYITIAVPGDTTTLILRPVRPGDVERFPRQYQAFKVNSTEVTGTPLSSWPLISKAQADELAFFRIVTLEQLAVVSDSNCQKYMGLSELRSKAKHFLEQMAAEAPALRLVAELAQRDETISNMQRQMNELQEQFAKMNENRQAEAA